MKKMNDEFERKLWKAADALRGNQSAEEYMHVVIGIMFLKHFSDSNDFLLNKYKEKNGIEITGDDLLDKDILSLANISFVVPEKAKWNYISKFATQKNIGEIIDNAFSEIERTNNELIGLFEKNYNREELDQGRLGMVVSEFSNLNFSEFGEDIIGRTYEYFLGEFFKKQGQKGGEFYTPSSIVELMVNIVDPKEGKVYDPAAGTGGMLVQAKKHIMAKGVDPSKLIAYGQEFQNKTWKLSRINLLLHGFHVDNVKLGHKSADTFTEDLHHNERFEYILANPPFNVKKWNADRLLNENDNRWEWGYPPKGNANYAWISHMVHKLTNNGRAATVLANGSLSSSKKEELTIRKNLIKDNLVDAIIALPSNLFYTVTIPACIWVFNKNKKTDKVLMLDASNLEGNMISKKLRELTKNDITKLSNIYNDFQENKNIDEIGLAKSVSLSELEENEYSFVPGRYVGFVEEEIDRDKIKKEIFESSLELEKLLVELNEITPKVNESIKKVLELQNE
ncbi:MAG: type I restriction-modification system subunit M [Mycoplasma sp.]|nr:type I restriction-modification system subunit M [Mycoplasma sp.]